MVLALEKLERYEDAVISLDRALEDDMANPELLTCKGYSLYHLKRYKESVEALGKSLKRRPQNPFTLLYRGKAYRRLSSGKRHLPVLKRTCHLRQKCFCLVLQGIMSFTDGTSRDALEAFDSAIALDDPVLLHGSAVPVN